jgi:hypothetical protein
MATVRIVAFLGLALLAGCASQPKPVAIVTPPPPIVSAPARPTYDLTGIVAPPQLADGSFATPNRLVSGPGAVWHLRAGLNVAALACRGPQDAMLASEYNALIARHRTELASAQARVSIERGGVAPFDDAMTRLYNYYAMPPAQPEMCRTAAGILAESALVAPGGFEAFAAQALPRLDAPYIAVFQAVAARNPVINPYAVPAIAYPARAPAAGVTAQVAPRLTLDTNVIGGSSSVAGGR